MNTIENPNQDTEVEILRAFCHVDRPNVSDFAAYLDYYQQVTRPTTRAADLFIPTEPAVSPLSHSEILEAARMLAYSCQIPQSDLLPKLAGANHKETIARTVMRVAFMIDCASRDDFPAGHKIQHGESFPVKWHRGQTFAEFFHATFPLPSPSSSGRSFRASQAHVGLKAWKLERRHGIRIVPTNDIVQHLLYDPKARTLAVFHQMAYLKAHIRHTTKLPLCATIEQSAKSGTLPPQLLLEILFSIYRVLLPLSVDKKSAKLAKRLVRRQDAYAKFDPALLVYDGLIRGDIPDDFQFYYLSERIKMLDHVVRNPSPASKVVSWIERHTLERNALTVAILGLFLNVIVGFLQLVVSILAWRYPVPQPT